MPTTEKLLTSHLLIAYLGRSLSSINRDVKAGRLPSPIKLGRNRYWRKAEVDEALELQRQSLQTEADT